MSKLVPLAALLACVALAAGDLDAARTPTSASTLGLTPVPPTPTSWVLAGLFGARPYRLAAEHELPLLERYLEPFRNHTPEARAFYRGAFGPAQAPWVTKLQWSSSAPEPELLALERTLPCPRWRAPRPITILRWAGERETLALTDCQGALLSDAVERVSVLARPPGVQRPELPLPAEPRGSDGERLPEVRLLHPRLLWVLSTRSPSSSTRR